MFMTDNQMLTADKKINFPEFPAIEEVNAANGLDEAYGPDRKGGYIKNKFPGYHKTTVQAAGKSTTLYSYTPISCLISNPVVLAVLDEGSDVSALFLANQEIADHYGFAILVLEAPENGFENDGPALIEAATALISPNKDIYNYYSANNRTIAGYGKGAAAVMLYLENDNHAANFVAAILCNPKGYVFSAEHADTRYGCAIKLVSTDIDENQKSFTELFRGNNGGCHIMIEEDETDALLLPMNIVGCFRHDGLALQRILPVRKESDPDYCGFSLRTIMADGILRYYYIYIPKSVKDATGKRPLVIAMHGMNARYIDYAYASGWLKVAEEENFIVVFPMASPRMKTKASGVYAILSWGNWDDTSFIQNALVPDILAGVNADPSRVYAFGFSSGCIMAMSQGISSCRENNPFAAVGGAGGWLGYFEPLGFATEAECFDANGELFTPKDHANSVFHTVYEKNEHFNADLKIPTIVFYGENDKVMAWGMGTANAQPGGPDFANPGIYRMLQFYREHFGLSSSMSSMMDSAVSYRDKDFSTHVFYNQNDIPMLRYEIVKDIAHIQNEAEARRAYAFLKCFSKAPDGSILYTGKSDNTGIKKDLLPLDVYGWFPKKVSIDCLKDVSKEDWFYSPVKYVIENNLINCTSQNSFDPLYQFTYAEGVMSIWHLMKEPQVCCMMPFLNVKADAYTAAVGWAVKNNIIKAEEGMEFAYERPVSREEYIRMLYQCAFMPAGPGPASTSSDHDDAMKWAKDKGILTESTVPDADTCICRAEAAAILQRFRKLR